MIWKVTVEYTFFDSVDTLLVLAETAREACEKVLRGRFNFADVEIAELKTWGEDGWMWREKTKSAYPMTYFVGVGQFEPPTAENDIVVISEHSE